MALRVMSEHGFTATSLSDLRRESKLPSSSIYHHFGSKADLLAAVIEHGARNYSEDLALASTFAQSASARESIRTWLIRDMDVFVKHEQFFRMVMLLVLTREVPVAARTASEIRMQGRSRAELNLKAAFSYAGEEAAEAAAAELTDFVMIASEGALLMSRETGLEACRRTLEVLADAAAALGTKLLER